MEATAIVTKTIDGKMPSLFTPAAAAALRHPPDGRGDGSGDTTARYQPGSPEAGVAGYYFVNTTKLDQRPLWEIPVLSVHEAVPGHHMQIALQQELDLPAWRKIHACSSPPSSRAGGSIRNGSGSTWACTTRRKRTWAALSYQMWRACRLVVDTGHPFEGLGQGAGGAFMKDNSALTDANIDAEVNRYISMPGQALAYKIGELKIEELRSRAEKALGPGSTSAASTTRCSARARCRWTRSKRRSTRGSPLRKRELAYIRAYCSGALSRSADSLFSSRAWLDHLLQAAGVAGRPDRRAAVDAGRADGFEPRALLAHAWLVWRGPPARNLSGMR